MHEINKVDFTFVSRFCLLNSINCPVIGHYKLYKVWSKLHISGVLGNLSALEDLDISYNDLHDLSTESNIFNLPENITHLRLNNDNLRRIPAKNIEKMTKLILLDIRSNELESIDYEIIKKIEKGLDVLAEGKVEQNGTNQDD